MNIIKTIFLYFFFVFAVGCKSKQKSIYIEKVKDYTVRNIVLETNNELKISNICDTLTSKAIEFVQVIETGNGKVKVTSKDNQLQIEAKTDSIVCVDREVIKEVEKEKETIKHTIPKWCYLTIILLMIFIIFPIVPKVIHGLIRNFF